ncbi:MAG: bifunctional glycosyltransferase family 2/GtrA family protein [Oscillospiraceae bacterium]|nr:bifunctional glycosyltransferase family 2/GtrA family protein [Oscillospiraceae bacterium]
MNVPVIIPTYNPKEKIFDVIDGLCKKGFENIVIIDDGSKAECTDIFSKIEEIPECVLLRHEINRGKGRGLKTGFEYVLKTFPDCDGVVTTDDDGQHTPDDIARCAEKMTRDKNMVLGARDFSQDNVPPKSRFGNNMTRIVFRLVCGIKITDTQTGLRAIPLSYLSPLCQISGERFEYETNMLLEMKRQSLPFEEETISTIYSDNNSETHFNPLTDSVKIYAIILKYALSSLICSLIDVGLFTLINLLTIPLFGENETLRIFTATAAARIVSSLTNYFVNQRGVFQSKQSVKKSIVRYYILAAAQLLLSFLLVNGATILFNAQSSGWQTLIKAVIDTILFFFSFAIQRDWVYK